MIVLICPGMHPPELTADFVVALESAIALQASGGIAMQVSAGIANQAVKAAAPPELWGLPSTIAPYAPDLIRSYVLERWQKAGLPADYPTVWIGFSAGVVGAVAAARRWQREGRIVRGLIAVDGWGVPLGEGFPRFRLGHDRFTAQSCEWLGASDGYFYSDPAVEHLVLWRSPQQAQGRWQPNLHSPFELNFGPLSEGQSITAVEVMAQLVTQLIP